MAACVARSDAICVQLLGGNHMATSFLWLERQFTRSAARGRDSQARRTTARWSWPSARRRSRSARPGWPASCRAPTWTRAWTRSPTRTSSTRSVRCAACILLKQPPQQRRYACSGVKRTCLVGAMPTCSPGKTEVSLVWETAERSIRKSSSPGCGAMSVHCRS